MLQVSEKEHIQTIVNLDTDDDNKVGKFSNYYINHSVCLLIIHKQVLYF